MISCPIKVQNASCLQIKLIIYLYTYYKLIIVHLVLHETSFRVQTICYALQVLVPKKRLKHAFTRFRCLCTRRVNVTMFKEQKVNLGGGMAAVWRGCQASGCWQGGVQAGIK